MKPGRTLAVIFTSVRETPGSAITASSACVLKRSRTGQAGVVSSNVNATSPASEMRRSLIIPRLTTSRPRSGSTILARAARTCSSLKAGMAHTSLGEPWSQRDCDPLQSGAACIECENADRAVAGEPGGRGGDVDESRSSDRLVAPAMGVAVDADVEFGCPPVARPRWPVDHSHLEALQVASHLQGNPRVVGCVAVDHGQRLAQPAEAVQDRVLLPVAGVPDLVHRGEMPADEVEQSLDAVASLGVADESEAQHHAGAYRPAGGLPGVPKVRAGRHHP